MILIPARTRREAFIFDWKTPENGRKVEV